MVTASGMKLPMTCGWTARPDTDVGAFVVTAMGFSSQEETRQAVRVISIALGALVVLLPTVLIGMCRVVTTPVPDDDPPVSRDTRGYRNNHWRIPFLEA